MNGLHIFIHSVRQVFGNLKDALRVSAVLWLLYIVDYIWAFSDMFDVAMMMETGQMTDIPDGLITRFLVGSVIAFLIAFWIAVSWHRFVLLEEKPKNLMPALRLNLVLSYLTRSLGLAVIGVFLAVVAMTVIGLSIGILFAPVMYLMPFLLLIALSYLFYRVSPVLPAAALGEPYTLRDAMGVTRPYAAAIFQASLLVFVFGFLVNAVSAPLLSVFADGSLIQIVLSGAFSWITFMVSISVLTTIYGVAVEERSLV
jgi:hypothetical protein